MRVAVATMQRLVVPLLTLVLVLLLTSPTPALGGTLNFTLRGTITGWSGLNTFAVNTYTNSSRLVLFTQVQVWESTNSGTTWTKKSARGLPSSGSANIQCTFVDASGRSLYVVSQNASNLSGGVSTYRSTDSGSTWSRYDNGAQYSWYPNACLSDSEDNLYKITNGPNSTTRMPNSIYRSTDSGMTWTFQSTAPWQGRVYSAVGVWHAQGVRSFDVVYFMGGEWRTGSSYSYYADVYYSTDSLATWVLASMAAPWGARGEASLAIAANGILLLSGGGVTRDHVWYGRNDIWASFNGGADWKKIEDSDVFGRDGGASVMLSDQSLAQIYPYTNALVYVSGVKMNNVSDVMEQAGWVIPVACIAPQNVCSTLVLPSSTAAPSSSVSPPLSSSAVSPSLSSSATASPSLSSSATVSPALSSSAAVSPPLPASSSTPPTPLSSTGGRTDGSSSESSSLSPPLVGGIIGGSMLLLLLVCWIGTSLRKFGRVVAPWSICTRAGRSKDADNWESDSTSVLLAPM